MTQDDKALVAQLLSSAPHMTGTTVIAKSTVARAADRIEALRAEVAEQARARGLAEGRLAASEMAGVVAHWRRRAEGHAAQVQRMREALERIDSLDEAMGHELKIDHAFEAVNIARTALASAPNYKPAPEVIPNGGETIMRANSPEIPDGWVMVPREPTEAMVDAGHTALSDTGVDNAEASDASICYRAMITAALSEEA